MAIALAIGAAGPVARSHGLGPPSDGAGGADWLTYAFDEQRSGAESDPNAISPARAPALHLRWRLDLRGPVITSPLYAGGVDVSGIPRDLVFVGTEHGDLFAVNAVDGTVVWHDRFGHISNRCYDTPDSKYGIGGTPVIDRAANRIYVAASRPDPLGVEVYALDLSTGLIAPGWPVTISRDPVHLHEWGALTLSGGNLYTSMASMCDEPPDFGRIAAIDTRTARVTATWYVVQGPNQTPVGGGGIWGFGGVAVDPSSGDVYVATGNAEPPYAEDQPYAERVARLTSDLTLIDSNHPALSGYDVDFGGTPMLYQPTGCSPELAVPNKTGQLFVYGLDSIGSGPVQAIQITENEEAYGLFIGLAAWSDASQMLYVSTPGPHTGTYTNGMLAFGVDGCSLAVKWQRTIGLDGASPVSSPTVANGVVYYGDGQGDRVTALDATTGRPLWNSGLSIDGPVFAPPIVSGRRLFVAAWSGRAGGALYAFED